MSVRLLYSGDLQYLVLWQEGLSTHRPADGQVSKPNPSLHLRRLIDGSSQFVPLLCCRIVKQELSHTQRESPKRAERHRTNGLAEPRPVDILELLSKAKEEYQRVRSKTHRTHRRPHTHSAEADGQILIEIHYLFDHTHASLITCQEWCMSEVILVPQPGMWGCV